MMQTNQAATLCKVSHVQGRSMDGSENVTIYRDVAGVPTPTEMNMASRAAAQLDKHYTGYRWQVAVRGAVAIVRNPALSADMGYFINLNDPSVTFEDAIMRAGGEILERHNLRRGNVDVAAYAEEASKSPW
tara:strand:+ start:2424 stop:2816 length:393 start_codon:yes stop_codon:yes gene_type:complete